MFIIQQRLRVLAYNTINILEKHNVNYWVDFGTLLGLVRENDIILYDNDVDICVVSKNLHENKQLVNDFKRVNLRFEKQKHWNAYRVYDSMGCIVDMYINTLTENSSDPNSEPMYKGATGKTSDIPAKYIGKPKRKLWKKMNIYYRAPEFTRDTLVWRYGEDYMTPKLWHKGRNY